MLLGLVCHVFRTPPHHPIRTMASDPASDDPNQDSGRGGRSGVRGSHSPPLPPSAGASVITVTARTGCSCTALQPPPRLAVAILLLGQNGWSPDDSVGSGADDMCRGGGRGARSRRWSLSGGHDGTDAALQALGEWLEMVQTAKLRQGVGLELGICRVEVPQSYEGCELSCPLGALGRN